MAFEFDKFFLSWLLAMTSDFLDASFLVTIALTLYAPCCGFRDNEMFLSIDRFLIFMGCTLGLILRVVLFFSGVDPLQWNGYCHAAAAFMLFFCFVEVLMKWRRAVYGRSQLATHLGRRLPEERGSRGVASAAPPRTALEEGRTPLALNNEAQSSDNVCAEAAQEDAVSVNQVYSCKCISGKLSHVLLPGSLVLFISANDAQTTAFSKLANDRVDMAMGESVGLICSTLLAILLGGFLRWYLHDTHLLLYMSLIFFGLMVESVKGTVVDMVQKDLPEATLM